MNIHTKSYESLLPFMVVETLSSQSSSFNSISVRIMEKGWAWLVSGRKLLVWKFKESKSQTSIRTRRTLSPCFELQLPQSDLIHKADLMNVFFIPVNPNTSLRAVTVPAALAVSPEGTIRFWMSVANERPTESAVGDLKGEEFCTLVTLSSTEYLIGTTTGSIFLLTIDVSASDPRSILVCNSLAAPSGLLSGISRRMTNLFFGPMSTDIGADSRRPLIAVTRRNTETGGSIDRTFFVASSALKLRQWARTNEGVNSQNQLVREWDLHKGISRKLSTLLRVPESQTLNFWPVDMITTKTKELLILIVTLDTSRDNTINYATCVFNPHQAADKIGKVTILRSHSWQYSNESEEQLLSLKFLERIADSPTCFMYDRKFLFLAQVDRDILDAVDYANQDDGILGAGFVDDQAVLFTQRDGLICVQRIISDRSRIDPGNDTTMNNDVSLASNDTTRAERQHQTSHQLTRAEPMLIEIDDEEEDRENNQTRGHQPRQTVDKENSTVNKSNLNNSTINKSVTEQTSRRSKVDDVSAFIRDNKEFEWILQLDSKQYALASDTLARVAIESETMQDRKETLLALSQLAKLAE